jgi:hypothetical protein
VGVCLQCYKGVARQKMHYHLNNTGLPTAQKPFTEMDDDDLDKHVAAISPLHPFAGLVIVTGHLEGKGIHLPVRSIQESLKHVDALVS